MKIAVVSPYPPSKGTLNEYAYHLIESMRLKEEVEAVSYTHLTLPTILLV